MTQKLRDAVRAIYDNRCGYCGVFESDSGGELTVDHFSPVSAGGGDDLDNLVYCCYRCNLYKSAFSPTETDLREGRRVLHPLHDDLEAHYVVNEDTYALESRTPMGEFNITLLHLNRSPLMHYRRGKHLSQLLREDMGISDERMSEERSLQEILRRIERDEST